jgi:phosphomannomutase/phosphoglucomutase
MSLDPGIFRQYDIRGVVGTELTVPTAAAVGRAFAELLRARGVRGAVAVGRDNRPSGAALHVALVEGILANGMDVVDIGIVPTPMLYWALQQLPVAAGIQITGSHNPPEYNGFKLCIGHDSLYGEGIQDLYRRAVAPQPSSAPRGTLSREEILDRYVSDLLERTGPLARRLKVVVDCGNGAGAIAAPALFNGLGVDWTCLFCESDGTFPNHHPDPTVVENLQDLIRAVRSERADIGIAFDGDADRIGIVDEEGRIIWGDHLLILYARDVLARTGAGQPIIFDVKCSQALPEEIERAGGKPIMWKTGHSLIKEKMKATGAPLAGEMSGHMFFREGFYGHDDALYGAARILRIVAASGRTVSDLLAGVPKFVSTPELRVDCPDDIKFGIVDEAVAHFRRTHEVIGVDGARVLFGDGWGLIRASNTQPILVLRFEARTEQHLAAIRAEMEGWLRSRGVAV